MVAHLEQVVAEHLVVDRVGAVLVVAIEQTLQLTLRDEYRWRVRLKAKGVEKHAAVQTKLDH